MDCNRLALALKNETLGIAHSLERPSKIYKLTHANETSGYWGVSLSGVGPPKWLRLFLVVCLYAKTGGTLTHTGIVQKRPHLEESGMVGV